MKRAGAGGSGRKGAGGSGRERTGRGGRGRKPAGAPRASRQLPSAPARSALILERLRALYPEAKTALHHTNPFELIVATILSAQTTDVRVNLVTPELFRSYPDPFALARARPADVEKLVQSTGFFRNKAKSIIGMAQALVADHHGEVPRDMASLVALPGVGRKTANVVLGNAFDLNEGVVVDTHVTRLSQRLGLTRHTEPVKIEQDLMKLFPRGSWALLSHLLIFHGRQICIARKPKCPECVLADICPSARL